MRNNDDIVICSLWMLIVDGEGGLFLSFNLLILMIKLR